MITRKEIDAQIALGLASTPQQIVCLIRKTSDPGTLHWAVRHKNTKVRMAAINNATLPVGLLLYASAYETAYIARELLEKVNASRHIEIDAVLEVIRYYPQLSMDLNNGISTKHS